MSKRLPQNWTSCAIGDVTTEIEQREPRADEAIIYVDIGSVNREKKEISSPQKMKGVDAPSRARKVIKRMDVLVSMTRPNLNAVAMVGKELEGEFASTGFDVLRSSKIDPRWLFYTVRSTAFIDAMSGLVQGALYPAVRSKDIRSFEIPLAPLAEQKRIADKLDSLLSRVDACRERLDRVPLVLKRFRQSVLAAAMSGALTEDWRNCSDEKQQIDAVSLLREISRVQALERITVRGGSISPKLDDLPDKFSLPRGWTVAGFDALAAAEAHALKAGPFGSALKKTMYVKNGYKIYGQEQVIGGDENLGNYFIDNEKFQSLKSCAVKPGDILISLVGTIGRVLILSNNCKPGIINPRLIKLSLHSSISRQYISLYLTSSIAQSFFERQSHGGTMDILNLGILRRLPILLPPADEQCEIVRRVHSLFALADNLEARIETARQAIDRLTPSILAKAFRGELVPQDPNDEPAAELLKRQAATTSVQPETTRSRRVTKARAA